MSEHIHHKDDSRVFTFGSNRLGIHGAGAARYAARELGAERGVGYGRTGRTYALATCEAPGVPSSLQRVANQVDMFLEHAEWCLVNEPETRFFVSAVGCGIAGFTEDEIRPMFAGAPSNVDLPTGWREANERASKETL